MPKKKKNFHWIFMQNFYPSTTVFMALKSSFRPNLPDLEKKNLISSLPWQLFDLRELCNQKQQKWLKMAFLAHFILHHIKTFLLKLIQHWLVGRFEGLTIGYQPAWNEFENPNGSWAIALSSTFYPQLDFGLYWGWNEAEIKNLGMILSIRVRRKAIWSLVISASVYCSIELVMSKFHSTID